MLRIATLLSALSITLASAQTAVEFPSYAPPGTSFKRVLSLANGDQLLIGSVQTQPSYLGASNQIAARPKLSIVLSVIGTAVFEGGEPSDVLPVLGGNGDDMPADAALDPSGNIWIVGSTDSDDFHLVNPIVATKIPYRTAGFVIELDPTGVNLIFATYLGGTKTGSPLLASNATHIVFDTGGNAYIAGNTDEPDFPVSPGALQPTAIGGATGFGDTYFDAFVAKISPAGALLYSSLLGGTQGDCSGGSSCIGKASANTFIQSLVVDTSGVVTLSGITNADDFPVTAGEFQLTCDCVYPGASGFVSRLSSDGTHLLWSTYLRQNTSDTTALFLAVDPAGNVDLLAQYMPPNAEWFATSPGLAAVQLSSDGTHLNYSTDLGQSADALAYGIALDASGNVYLAGQSSSPQFPTLPNVPNLGADFVLRLDPTGAIPKALYRFPSGTITLPPVFDLSGNLLLLKPKGALRLLPLDSLLATPSIIAVGNAASFSLDDGLYTGELISLFGFNLAPAAYSATLDAAGNFPVTLGGVQVLIGGTPAPLLYVGPNQINLQVPFVTSGLPGISIPSLSVSYGINTFSPALPGLFYAGSGPFAAALNQDGSANSATNPAAAGSIVSLFGTGLILPSGLSDGAIASAAMPLSQVDNNLQVVDGAGVQLNILYAGAAPGLINGVFQLNVQLPANNSSNPTLTLRSTVLGTSVSGNPVQIYTQ